MIYMFMAGYIGILFADVTWNWLFNSEYDFKSIYYGTCGYWLAVLLWALN